MLEANAKALWFLCNLQLCNLYLQSISLNRSMPIACASHFLCSTLHRHTYFSPRHFLASKRLLKYVTMYLPLTLSCLRKLYRLSLHCHRSPSRHSPTIVAPIQLTAQCNLPAQSIKNLILNFIRNWLSASRNAGTRSRNRSFCLVWQSPCRYGWCMATGLLCCRRHWRRYTDRTKAKLKTSQSEAFEIKIHCDLLVECNVHWAP